MFSLQERAIDTTEKLATQIRSHSRIKEIQKNQKSYGIGESLIETQTSC